jgi:flavin reductase (DIM6/NTAB) family NADH-FMN oxidoreductase RutF
MPRELSPLTDQPSSLGPVDDRGAEQRALFRRWPAGVSIVVAEVDGVRHGRTVSSLVSLSLEPALVGVSVAHSASIHELLRDAETWGVSILAGGQEELAQRFARSGVPPLVLWDGVPLRADDPRLIEGAAGWMTVRTLETLITGDHTFFVGEVESVEEGTAPTTLVYAYRDYHAL